ncbi:hypothetical protein ABMA27_002117 [Loxostege sticticalis]|uniref:BTB domain-containing protein n=1 Tax=Loxostege sticticalis TaxID=481309 RepID=A0ABR3HWL8_LOXSC
METNFRLCWETFKNNLCDGFSKLQQMEEFVDVTLAAGGHFVKAHQNIIAVASPYIKDMLKSTPCQHPVIFLGPISHTVLCFILEYIYTGEVNVPSHVLPAFVNAAKLLHIAGIKDLQLPQVNHHVNAKSNEDVNNKHFEDLSKNNISNATQEINENCLEDPEISENCLSPELNKESLVNYEGDIQSDNCDSAENLDESFTSQPIDSNGKSNTDLDFDNLLKIKTNLRCSGKDTLTSQDEQPNNTIQDNVEFNDYALENDNQMDVPAASLNNDCGNFPRTTKESKKNKDISVTPLYTRSNRGAIQMVMNRFIYYLHHTSFGKQKRRWRCIQYRRQRCAAYIDTNGELITSRQNLHNHPFQDKEIFKFGRRKQFFTSLAEANNTQWPQQSKKCNTREITETNTEEENQYEIKIDLSKFPIT